MLDQALGRKLQKKWSLWGCYWFCWKVDSTMCDYSATIFNLVEYEVWCNLQAVDFLSSLSDEECRRDFGFGLRTPHRTVSHIADVMRGWSGCVGPTIEQPSWPNYDAAETLAEIRKRIADIGESW